jgi:hypothetical protein
MGTNQKRRISSSSEGTRSLAEAKAGVARLKSLMALSSAITDFVIGGA